MTCNEAQARWHDQADGEIPDPQLEQHLSECETCRRYAAQMSRMFGALDELRMLADHIVSSRHRESIPAMRGASGARRGLSNSILRVAAVVGLAIGAVTMIAVTRRSSQPPVAWNPTEQEPQREAEQRHNTVPPIGIGLRGNSRSRLLAVAATTQHKNVQLYWLYPLLREKIP